MNRMLLAFGVIALAIPAFSSLHAKFFFIAGVPQPPK
jgi:hypothetical protein